MLLEGKLDGGVFNRGVWNTAEGQACAGTGCPRSVLGLVPSSLEDAPSVTAMQTKQKTGSAISRLEKEDPVSSFDSRLKCQTGNNLCWLTGARGDLVKRSGNSG